ncbi:MAG: ThuA domain-containing protein [Armatimonadota bacterium]
MSDEQVIPRRVLLFGGGGVHPHLEACPILQWYLETIPGFAVDYVTEDYDAFLAERLAPYDLIVLYHTGAKLTVEQRRGLNEGIAGGKGFVGLHGATCSFENAPEYLAMIGGLFRGHPFVRDYLVSLADYDHPVTREIKGYDAKDWEKWPVYEYMVNDEQYLLDYDPRARILATALFRGVAWPVAWVKPWGQGKVFYLALGHHAQACEGEFFRAIFTNGAIWAASDEKYEEKPTTRFAIS